MTELSKIEIFQSLSLSFSLLSAFFTGAKIEIHYRAKYNREDISWSFLKLQFEELNPYGYMYGLTRDSNDFKFTYFFLFV